MLCFFSALSCQVGTLQISIIIIKVNDVFYYKRGFTISDDFFVTRKNTVGISCSLERSCLFPFFSLSSEK